MSGVGGMTGSDRRTALPAGEAIEPWKLRAADVVRALDTSAESGLEATVAAGRLGQFGRNELVEKQQRPTWMLFVDQFTSPMILVLIAAAVVTFLIGHGKDTVVILAIVVFNGVVGFVQEYRAGQAMDALKQMSSPQARLVRGGETTLVPAAEVVPGDIVLLEQGDIVTADMRLLEAPGLKINEAPLTGESEPVAKVTEPLPEVGCEDLGRPAQHGLLRHRRDPWPRAWPGGLDGHVHGHRAHRRAAAGR